MAHIRLPCLWAAVQEAIEPSVGDGLAAVHRAEAAARRAQALNDGDEESAGKALAEQKLAQKNRQYLTGLIRDLMTDNSGKPIRPSESTKYGVRPIRPQVRYGIRTGQ